MDRFKETADAYNRFAEAYENKFMDLNLYDDTYDAFCYLLPAKGKVLELGCGPGNITRYLIAKRPDIIIDATDFAPNMVARAQKNNPTANCFELDCRNLKSIQKNYDAIVAGFCLPYLPPDSCRELISESNRLLNANGILYLSTIEGTEKDSGYIWNSAKTDRIYMYYHTLKFITDILESHGFTTIESFRKEYISDSGKSFHLIFIAQKMAQKKRVPKHPF